MAASDLVNLSGLIWCGCYLMPRRLDLNEAQWEIVAPLVPAAKPGGRPRTTCLRSVLDAIFFLLRTGCRWRLLPRCFPPWGSVYHHFRLWQRTGTWMRLHRAVYARARLAAGRKACPTLVIMDAQSVKTTERGGARLRWPQAGQGPQAPHPDGHAGAGHCEPRRAGRYLRPARGHAPVRRPAPVLPCDPHREADAGHQSRKLARALKRHEGWDLVVTRRGQRAFKITGLTWIGRRFSNTSAGSRPRRS